MNSIDYYDRNADSFTANTVSIDFHDTQDKFLSYLPPDSLILDFGCGSGRDTKYFLEHGRRVEAVDGSREMCRYAGRYTGIPVRQMLFDELDAEERYDGIWACSSVLHLSYSELADVLKKMTAALKPGGIIYMSFKYGTFEGERNGRYFTDLTEDSFAKLIRKVKGLKIMEQWITSDARPERADEKWLNLICTKPAERSRKQLRKTRNPGAYQQLSHEFPPVYDADSRILILGSFPSVKSREQQFYYGHPQNRFWKVLAGLLKESLPQSVEEKKAFLHRNHIALWDVIDSCEIIGSSDSSIRNVSVTDLSLILDKCFIRRIYTNGGTAGRLFKKYQKDRYGVEAFGLPSTSPANAAYSLERLTEEWKCILDVLDTDGKNICCL